MKLALIVLTMSLASLTAGCASTTGKSAAEANPGKFVTYSCEDKKSFQARFNPEEGTVRVRTKQGAAELTKGGRGLYRDDENTWILALDVGNKTELVHKGKAIYKNCAAA